MVSEMTDFWTVVTTRGSKRGSNGSFSTKTGSKTTIRGSGETIQGFRENNQASRRIINLPGELATFRGDPADSHGNGQLKGPALATGQCLMPRGGHRGHTFGVRSDLSGRFQLI